MILQVPLPNLHRQDFMARLPRKILSTRKRGRDPVQVQGVWKTVLQFGKMTLQDQGLE
jgi:hypothetical protein